MPSSLTTETPQSFLASKSPAWSSLKSRLLRVAQAECNEPELRDFLFKGTAVQDDEDDEDNEEQNASDPPPNTHEIAFDDEVCRHDHERWTVPATMAGNDLCNKLESKLCQEDTRHLRQRVVISKHDAEDHCVHRFGTVEERGEEDMWRVTHDNEAHELQHLFPTWAICQATIYHASLKEMCQP